MDCQGFVIHLDRAVARRPQAELIRAALPMPSRILSAVDGLGLSETALARHARRSLHAPRYPFSLSRTEIACFLSHRQAWQAIVDGGHDAGLIVEDDVAVASPQFAEVLANAVACIQPHEFIRFPQRERGERGPAVRTAGPLRLIEPWLPACGMVMQVVGREAARRLLRASTSFDRPVDSFVQMQWLHGATVLSARPIIVREICARLGGSVIHCYSDTLVNKLVHEFNRPIIRLAVRQANDEWRRRSA
jgi:GR25 family glycosyltransferase involved in LPS biosynthesis